MKTGDIVKFDNSSSIRFSNFFNKISKISTIREYKFTGHEGSKDLKVKNGDVFVVISHYLEEFLIIRPFTSRTQYFTLDRNFFKLTKEELKSFKIKIRLLKLKKLKKINKNNVI